MNYEEMMFLVLLSDFIIINFRVVNAKKRPIFKFTTEVSLS